MVRAYQRVCTEVIQRYDGHIAQLLGDGLLVYFGYPQAHEDDAHRAVRTGLGILAAMGDLNQRLQQAKGIQLAIRVGIHTGLVVVGEMGGAGTSGTAWHWEKPRTLLRRIQGLAAPNTLVISDATYRLVQGYFACQDLGAQTLRGVAEPITCTASSARVVPQVALMWLSHEDSHRWSVENQKSHSSWNVGHKPKLGKGRWSYSRVMQALEKSGWSKC